MRAWVDMTASAHPLVFRPLIALLRRQGHEVEITARDYAQTLQLIEQHGLEAEVIGHHGGRSRLGKARQMTSRLGALRRWARGRDFDVALAHGSHELTMTARRLDIPSATTFDYEWAWLQHQLGCRAATRVVVPEWIPPERLASYGATPPKLVQYQGLKEEYYLADFEPDGRVLDAWELDPARTLVVLRPPPDVSLYHRHSNPLFPLTLRHLGELDAVHALVLLNREAAALGVPVYTTYGGRLGGVDEELIREGRLRPLTDPRALELVKRDRTPHDRIRRDPQVLLDLLLSAVSAVDAGCSASGGSTAAASNR